MRKVTLLRNLQNSANHSLTVGARKRARIRNKLRSRARQQADTPRVLQEAHTLGIFAAGAAGAYIFRIRLTAPACPETRNAAIWRGLAHCRDFKRQPQS